jgi:two-component system, NarL family, sensor histidine kinase UhpB
MDMNSCVSLRMIEPHLDILLVEDSATDAMFTSSELVDSEFGPFSVTHVRLLEEALELVQARRFDAVLLDLGLPDCKGLETLQRLRKKTPHDIPIVVLSGMEDEALRLRALREGAEDYLVKGESEGRLRSRSVRYAIERRRVAEALLESERQLAMAVDATKTGIFDWNIASGKVTWSYHHAQLFGMRPEEFGGKYEDFERCVHPDDRAQILAKVNGSIASREDYQNEFRIIWADGSEHWIEARGKVFTDEQGQPLRMMGTVVDISQRKAAEESAKIREAEAARLLGANLTPRERTLLKLVIAGMPNKRIAADLNISIKTVAKHRAHLMTKTRALNAADLARMSTLAGVVAGK